MGQKEAEFTMKLRQMMAGSNTIFMAEVKSVNQDDNTCTIDYNGVDVEGVSLGAKEEKDKTLIVYPKIGKPAIFARIGNSNQMFLLHCAEAEKIIIEVGTSILEIVDGQITINGGDNKGLVKVDGLKSQLNSIENSINQLKNILSSWTPVANDGGAALKASSASWAGQQLTQTALGDIENEKVKH